MEPIDNFNQWSTEFNLRAKLTSRLIIKGKDLPKDIKDNIMLLVKSDLYTDLIVAEEILDALAI